MVLTRVVLNHRVLTSKIACVYVLVNLSVFNSLFAVFSHFFTIESWKAPEDDSALPVLRPQGGGGRALLVFPWILGPFYSLVFLHFYSSFPIKDFEQSRRVQDFIFFILTAQRLNFSTVIVLSWFCWWNKTRCVPDLIDIHGFQKWRRKIEETAAISANQAANTVTFPLPHFRYPDAPSFSFEHRWPGAHLEGSRILTGLAYSHLPNKRTPRLLFRIWPPCTLLGPPCLSDFRISFRISIKMY